MRNKSDASYGCPWKKYVRLEVFRVHYNPKTVWCMCIGVPYGKSLWQVGNLSQQNGLYKMVSVKFKQELLRKKRQKGMSPHIFLFEIMLIINNDGSKTCMRVDKKKEAI